MPPINKNSTPWILVLASMILLFLFVGYWNVSTYLKEKKQLAEDVEIQLQLAFTEIKDSELVYFIRAYMSGNIEENDFPDSISIFLDRDPVFPSLLNNIQSKVIKEMNHTYSEIDTAIVLDIQYDTTQLSTKDNEYIGRDLTVIASSKANTVRIDGFEHRGNDSTKSNFRFEQINIHGNPKKTNKNFHLLSDTNYISSWLNTNDSLHSKYGALIELKKDSLLNPLRFFDQTIGISNSSVNKTFVLFKEKLIDNNLPDSFMVVSDPSTLPDGMRIKYETDGFGFTNWTVDLKKYQLFILQKMIPTVLFSLFLLGIISLAFWTLLTNWIKQNRLVVVKNEFINNMTHELKTPIATVGVALEAISNFDLSKDQDKTKEYIDISRNEINRLSLLVDKVLNIAAFDSKGTTLKLDKVDLVSTIEDIIQSMKLQLDNKNAQINFTKNGSNFDVVGDKLHIGNVVHNIMDNALKYSSAHSKIDVNLIEHKDNLVLSFTDNGKGIPKEYQSKIFDRFFRVPSADLHDVKGHGLGLNYVQNIVRALDGKIEVKSIVNQSTTFTITLPKSVSDV